MSEQVSPELGDRSDRPINLMLIDSDSIYRTGLRLVLELARLQVVTEAENSADALRSLSELSDRASNTQLEVDLVLLDLHLSPSDQISGLELCQRLKNQYPQIAVLLLSSELEPTELAAAQEVGVNGYCSKGIPPSELVAAIFEIAAGRFYWKQENRKSKIENPKFLTPVVRFTNRLRLSGVRQINTSLAQVTSQLQNPGLTVLEQAFLAGQRRELLAARWVVNHLLATPEYGNQESGDRRQETEDRRQKTGVRRQESELGILPISRSSTRPQSLADPSSSVLASVRQKLQFNLENLTRVPLEIDILRDGKKRELLSLILQKVENTLMELRVSQVQSHQLIEMRRAIALDLWQATIIDFFGRYSTLQVGDRQIEIVNTLLQAEVVQTEILDKIPLIVDLFSYLLFKEPLLIDNLYYTTDNPEIEERAEIILQNLLIQLANAVVQPLLNYFADVEAIKQTYYDRRLISTREIERFRNNLSWKYRIENYFGEPTKIFESRYEMFLLVSRGIAKISIYAPRRQELTRLSGIPLVVTLALEFRDAIAPRLRAVVGFFGNGVVYILTQVVGRAIGLIGRGILQGLGGSLQESKNKRFKDEG